MTQVSIENEIKIIKLIEKIPQPQKTFFIDYYRYGELTYESEKYNCILMEKGGISLSQELKEIIGYTFNDKISILSQIAESIKILHDNNIVHRDIKLKNILINEDKNIKIIDFDGSFYKNTKNTQEYIMFSSPATKNNKTLKLIETKKKGIKEEELFDYLKITDWFSFCVVALIILQKKMYFKRNFGKNQIIKGAFKNSRRTKYYLKTSDLRKENNFYNIILNTLKINKKTPDSTPTGDDIISALQDLTGEATA